MNITNELTELMNAGRPIELGDLGMKQKTDVLLAEFRSRQEEYFDDNDLSLGGIDTSSQSKLTEMLTLVNQMEKEIQALRAKRL